VANQPLPASGAQPIALTKFDPIMTHLTQEMRLFKLRVRLGKPVFADLEARSV
jgi:hypothetical protein